MEIQQLFIFLFLHLSIVLSVRSPPCNSEIEYGWPNNDHPTLCCTLCQPGDYRFTRCSTTDLTDTVCKRCEGGMYTETFNDEASCEFCHDCNMTNMEYITQCDINRNSKCQCKTGYRCTGEPCLDCVPATPRPTDTTTVTKSKTTRREVVRKVTTLGKITTTEQVTTPTAPTDLIWIVASGGVLTMAIVLIVITTSKSFLRWIRSNGFCSPKKAYAIPLTDDEDVPMPVQEMCGQMANVTNPLPLTSIPHH